MREYFGIAKLIEECGEVVQVAGKLMAYPDGVHPDMGLNLQVRLINEMADLQAAIDFMMASNGLNANRFTKRRAEKLALFNQWEMAGIAATPPCATPVIPEQKGPTL